MTGLHDGHRRRLTNKALQYGIEGLEEHEVIELLLFNTIPRGNTNEIAHLLLNKFGSLCNICTAAPEELLEINGIGTKSVDFFKTLPLFVKSYELSCFGEKLCLNNTETIGKYCAKLFIGAAVEEMYVIYLNINYRIIKRVSLGRGSSTTVWVNFKEILKNAINTDATYVVLSHNHPNGVLFPSQNDINFTTNIATALDNIGVTVLDHIIVSNGNYFSFSAENISIYK